MALCPDLSVLSEAKDLPEMDGDSSLRSEWHNASVHRAVGI